VSRQGNKHGRFVHHLCGHPHAQPLLAGLAPPTDKEYNVVRAFEAGWGGVVWKTLGEDGPPIVNVSGPRYGALLADRACWASTTSS
jgi:dihydropyrimidine dehydrogenase (NAD+) subunit PreA